MVTLGKTEGAVRRAALGGIAASLVLGLAACGSAAAGAGNVIANPAVGKPSKATSPAGQINPGGRVMPASSKHVLLCMQIPRLARMSVTRTPWPPPPHHAREALPTGFTIRNAATVRRIASLLCALPPLPQGVMSCPELVGGSFRLFFDAPGKAIPSVGIQYSGCRVVSGLGPPRSWAASAAMQHEVSQGFGAQFRLVPPKA